MKKKCGRMCAAAGMLAAAALLPQQHVQAVSMPYETYSYDWWAEDVLQPHTYLYTGSLLDAAGEQQLKNPQDMFERDGLLYIADTENNRIVVLSGDGGQTMEISEFVSETGKDSLLAPQGVYVTEQGSIYAADSGNGRLVEFDKNGKYVRQIGRPETELLAETQKYVPTKVVVDHAGRIYVVAYGINMGLVEFNERGEFQGFMGAAKVSVSPFEYIWKNYFSTAAQKQRMQTIIPTEYSNIYVDEQNFVYATISNLSDEDHLNGADAVRRLNPTGEDVLRRLGNYDIIGDLYTVSDTASWSMFTDIAATDYGCYFILDNAGGKIFCYDYDGNSLFIFGGKGNRSGLTKNPVSVAVNGDQSRLYILDSQLNNVLTYEITEYGADLLGALKAHFEGNSQEADRLWKEVQKYNANSEIAYIGMGKNCLREGDYKQAMEYFKLGNSRKYYTKAFKFYRKELMQQSFAKGMGVMLLLAGLAVLYRLGKKIRRWVGEVKCRNI